MLNRHFFILTFCVVFIGILFWWQTPAATVTAMAKGESIAKPYNIVKNYWNKLDYRQFHLAEELTAKGAQGDHASMEKIFTENPLLSLQKIDIELTPEHNTFLVKTSYGSLITHKQECNYAVKVDLIEGKYLISSIKTISL